MAKISKLIDELKGKTEEEIRTREQYCFLQKMASAKSETFENRLKLKLSKEETAGAPEIVGGRAYEYHSGQHVNISQQCDDAVPKEIAEFFKGSEEVKAGFQKLVKKGLSGPINDTSIGETEETKSFVFPENYAIVRVDVTAYKYAFSSEDVLANNVENVFVYTMAKSIVDCKKVSLDSLLHAVVDILNDDTGENLNIEQVMPFVKELQMYWKLLDENAISASASDLLRG
ncbi:hypothetical protein GS424_010915 [Eggerthella guodeyinii]|uniref:Uncharacterized protein n=1 Tax=Eggerthella guodeyinii TaxID=2690837 RepID=A0A7M1ZRG4_9ACTN|nr:hypothetical protein [Eggerthella guodeyinii]QOS67055.1 hypothetical protein GS424_010915 [Eggerthella guodeyinii]